MTPKTCGFKNTVTGLRDCPELRWKDGATYCAKHEDEYRQARKGATPGATRTRRVRVPSFDTLRVAPAADGEMVTDEQAARSHEYVPAPELTALWHAVVTGAQTRPASNLMFVGPSGSGKTDGARYLAALVGLEFTKVDSSSMTDPESWFGTRELVVEDGVAVTDYRPSAFVEALQRPGVLLLDEINRVRDEHRNVLIPVLDHTRAVMNPLTGEVVNRHPQCFIIMSGNIGLHFTGTNAIDPAFMTRSLTVEFDYMPEAAEVKVTVDASGCDEESAAVFVRFATETRMKAKTDEEFVPVSTREVIEMGRLVADGLNRDLAVKFTVLNAASSEGGSASIRSELEKIWAGVRIVKVEANPAYQAAASTWTCPAHGQVKIVPAGTSSKTGRPYSAFRACPVFGCQHTEGKSPSGTPTTANGTTICGDCNTPQPAGRSAICFSCGAALS